MGEIILVKKIIHRVYSSLLGLLSDERGIIVLFFLLLFSALFFGDGKQPIVDLFLSGYAVFFGLYWFLAKKKLKLLPAGITWLWFATIIYAFIRTFTSDSVGYSLYTLNRFVLAYLIFHFFYTIASGKTVRFFYHALLFFVVSATAGSVFMMVFPAYGRNLPLMNLLYPNYGHNYLAYLLVFLVPIAVQQVSDRRRFWDYALVLFVAMALILTFARGAWLLIAVYACFLAVFQKKKVSGRQRLLFIGLSVILFGLFIGLFNFNRDKTIPTPYTNIALEQFLIKQTPIQNRIEYWRQAVKATGERPLFGSGPGTFYLESKRLQKAPLNYSWFAHSFPLQIMVEFGLVGSCLIFLLLYQIFFFIIQRFRVDKSDTKKYAVPLFWGTLLTFGYSIYEFNLDFLVVWLLFWSLLGIICRTAFQKNTVSQKASSFMIWFAVTLSGLGYIILLSALLFSWSPTKFLLVDKAVEEAHNTRSFLSLIKTFHKKNPEVLFAITQENPAGAIGCEQLILLDKKNKSFQQKCLKLLFASGDKKGVGVLLFLLGQDIVPKEVRWRLTREDFTNQFVLEALDDKVIDESLFSNEYPRQGYAKLVYAIGLRVVEKDPLLVKRLWLLARDVSPGWSYYHVEVASLDAWVFHDSAVAKLRLERCAELKDPRVHCLYVLAHTIPPVGSQKDSVFATQ